MAASEVDFGGEQYREAGASESGDGPDVTPNENLPILSLPSPVDPRDSLDGKPDSTRVSGVRVRWTRKVLKMLAKHREPLVKLAKSSLLLAKVSLNSSHFPGIMFSEFFRHSVYLRCAQILTGSLGY